MGNASNLGAPPRPTLFRCVSRGPTTLLLEWEVPDPQEDPVTHCEVQVSSSFLGTSVGWTDVVFAGTEVPRRDASVFSNSHWRARVDDLRPETVYEMRVRGCNKAGEGEWFSHPFKTSIRPDAPISLTCISRKSDAIDLEWQIIDPDGAAVESCDVQIAGAVTWNSAVFCAWGDISKPARWKGDKWRARIIGLQGATTYEVRVRGSNAVSAGDWLHLSAGTSSRPSAPSDISCRRRHADGLVIEWKMADPDGAEVLDCQVEIAGALTWYPAELLTEPRKLKDSWHASLVNLHGATSYNVRVRGRNAVGEGPFSQHIFSTAELPVEPVNLECSERSPFELALIWTVMSPEGAAVLQCEVEIFKSLSWTSATTAPGCQPQLLNGVGIDEYDSTRVHWNTRVVELEGATEYEIRVRAINAVGAGPWCHQLFKTAWTPSGPFDFKRVCCFPNKVYLEWRIYDPEGAAVTDCEIESSGSLNWSNCNFDLDQKPQKSVDGLWSVTIIDLLPDTEYHFRVRGLNVCGPGPWLAKSFKTSEKPGPPIGIRCARRQADRLHLEWEVDDPDGAPVTNCEVQLQGTVFWAEAVYDELAGPRWLRDRVWGATVTGLVIDTMFEFRIRCENECGVGPWSETGNLATQGKPEKPNALQWFHAGDHAIQLTWQVADLDGAPVTEVNLEVLTESSLSSPYYALPCFTPDGSPKRFQGDQWSATLASIALGAKITIRLRAVNLAGPGPWLRQELLLFENPDVVASP